MKPKLEVELIPQSAFGSNLRTALPKERWDSLRRECYKKANNRCEICDGVGPKHPVEAHEVWDWNQKEGRQTLIRLIALCPPCHTAKHLGLANIHGRLEEAKLHIREVNNWSGEELQTYLDSVWSEWIRRSAIEWTLDLEGIT